MDVVGREFEQGIRFIPEMLVSAKAMKAGMSILRPLLVDSDAATRGTVVIGTVEGDLHDIGKNLVAVMLEGAGYQVFDLGVEVSADRFCEAVREHSPQVVALSALLTTTMVHMPKVLDALQREGLRESVRVVVGGAPVTAEYARSIGADGHAQDASAAVALVRRLTEEL